jgi:hypothetical protein
VLRSLEENAGGLNRVGCCSTGSIHPPPSMQRWATSLKFVIPTAVEGSAVCVDGETKPGGSSPTTHLLVPKVKLQVPPLRYPGFPVELNGVGELHAAFLTESRTRGRWLVPRSRKFGYAPVGMTNLRAMTHLGMGGGGWTDSNTPRAASSEDSRTRRLSTSPIVFWGFSRDQLNRSFILPSRLREVGLFSMCMDSPSWRSRSRCALLNLFGVCTTICTTRSPRPCSLR